MVALRAHLVGVFVAGGVVAHGYIVTGARCYGKVSVHHTTTKNRAALPLDHLDADRSSPRSPPSSPQGQSLDLPEPDDGTCVQGSGARLCTWRPRPLKSHLTSRFAIDSQWPKAVTPKGPPEAS